MKHIVQAKNDGDVLEIHSNENYDYQKVEATDKPITKIDKLDPVNNVYTAVKFKDLMNNKVSTILCDKFDGLMEGFVIDYGAILDEDKSLHR